MGESLRSVRAVSTRVDAVERTMKSELVPGVRKTVWLTQWAKMHLQGEVAASLGPDGALEQMERRFLGSFEAERLRSAERHRELAAHIEQVVSKAHLGSNRRITRAVTQTSREELREIEAILQAYARTSPRALMPASGDFALNARSLVHLLDVVRAKAPQVVVELGSGTSTVWLAYVLQGSGARIISIDHDPLYAAKTRAQLVKHGLTDVAEVRVAELSSPDETLAAWYDMTAFEDVTDIDILVVDGPPESVGPLSRLPALPQLFERLSSDALVLLDDADRPGELETIERWTQEFPLRVEDEGISRIAVLRRTAG